MKFHEKESEQRTIILLGTAVFVAGFLVISIVLRLQGLNQVSTFIVLADDAGVLLGYCLILWVFEENIYASRTIDVVDGQKVITTGPCSIIRHPMYLGLLVMYLLTPIAFGSCLDISSQVKDFDEAREFAKRLMEEVLEKENLTCSAGVAPNKLVAKIASDFKKPYGLTVVQRR